MRLYHLLLVSAAALLAAGDTVSASNCAVKTSAPAATTTAPETSSDVADVAASTSASTASSYVDDDATSVAGEASDESDDVASVTEAPATTTAAPTTSASSDADASAVDADTSTAASASTSTTTTSTSTDSSTAASTSTDSSTTTTSAASASSGFCSEPGVTVTEIDVDADIDANEEEAALNVVAIAAMPSGGSRIAFQSGDSVIVRELDADDKLVESSAAVEVPLVDFADLYADDDGFVILGTRDAEGGGTLNCGDPSNLCGTAPDPAVPCYDMYLVRYDGSTETWATKLTSSSADLPPYSTSGTGEDVYMIWWYAHHGRLAYDGTNWAAYFGAAISTSQDSCINIHQGDRMKVVDPSGAIVADDTSFDWGCSHSGYERITYDNRTDDYAMICKTDSNNRIMPPNNYDATIYPVDLDASNLGDIVQDSDASSSSYWATVSNSTSDSDEDDAVVHLIHFALDAAADKDLTLGGVDANERAPHLAAIGEGGLLAMWEGSATSGDLVEGSSDRTIYVQVRDAGTGAAISDAVTVSSSVVGNRYQALKSYPDGSVAYLSKGTTDTSLQVVRFTGC